VQACRTVFVDRGSAADFLEAHFALNLAPHLVVAVAGDAAVAASMVHRRKLTAVSLFPLRPVRLLHRPVGVARLPGLGLCRVQPARVKHLRAVRMTALSQRDEFARRAYPQDRAPRPPRLFPDPVPGCPLRARQHELAAEHSLDFRL
jgi:hypothetical protein